MGKKVRKKLGEKMGEKTGGKVGESLGEIHKLNICQHLIHSVPLYNPIFYTMETNVETLN